MNVKRKEILSAQESFPLSVVIATLGGDVIDKTIRHLNEGPRIPYEILICIPNDLAEHVKCLNQPNVKIVRTPVKGQVAQRAHGLLLASQPYVLQLDDDIVITANTLACLVARLEMLGVGHAIGPLYRHLSDGSYLAEYPKNLRGWLQSLSASLICGAPWGEGRMGLVSPAGIGYGVGKRGGNLEALETEWLPGGCVLCHREDLVTYDYYPFAGKAFSEDLIHSVLWRRKGVRLWADPTAECMTAVAPMPFNWRLMLADLRAHEYVVSLIGGALWRLRLWYAVFAVKQTVLWLLAHSRSAIQKLLPKYVE